MKVVWLFVASVDSEMKQIVANNEVCPFTSDNVGKNPLELESDYRYSCASCCSNGLIDGIRNDTSAGWDGQSDRWEFDACNSTVDQTECTYLTNEIELELTCSPNNFLWFSPESCIKDFPLCSSWCQKWYSACSAVPVCTNKEYPVGAGCLSSISCKTFEEINKLESSWDEAQTALRFCYEFFDLGTISIVDEQANFARKCINPSDKSSVTKILEEENKKMWAKNETIPIFSCEPTGVEWWVILLLVLGILLVIGLVGGLVYFCCVKRKSKKTDNYQINSTIVDPKAVMQTNATADVSNIQLPGMPETVPIPQEYQHVTLQRTQEMPQPGYGNGTGQSSAFTTQTSLLQPAHVTDQRGANPAYFDSDYV